MLWMSRAQRMSRSQLTVYATLAIGLIVAVAYIGLGAWSSPFSTSAQSAPGAVDEIVDDLPSGRPATIGAPRDPLSRAEIGYAKALADPTVADATGTAGRTEAELLSIDLATMDPGTATRLVAVTYYDYGTDEVVTTVVDLSAGAVVETERAAGVQPPPSPAEVRSATELLIASPEGARLATEYLVTTGQEISVDDLIVTGGSYLPTDGSDLDDACGTHRCVELQIQEPGGLYLSAVDYVVDLSAEQIIVLTPGDDHEHGN